MQRFVDLSAAFVSCNFNVCFSRIHTHMHDYFFDTLSETGIGNAFEIIIQKKHLAITLKCHYNIFL